MPLIKFDLTSWRVVRDALFLDIPYIVDSVCRHADYRLNRLHTPGVSADPTASPTPWPPALRPYWALPVMALFAAVLVLAAHGPTFVSVCALLGSTATVALGRGVGWALVALAPVQFAASVWFIQGRIRRRFDKQGLPRRGRYTVVTLVFAVVLAAWAAPWAFFGRAVLDTVAREGCQPLAPPWPAAVQALALALAIAVAAWRSGRAATLRRRLAWQAGALSALVALMAFLPGLGLRTEAAQVPYPHVFGVVSVGFAVIAWLATWLVDGPFRSVTAADAAQAQQALSQVELFPGSRDDPVLSPRRIVGGLVIGVMQQPLQFLLLPAFAVLLVPEGFLWQAGLAGAVASGLLTVASALTTRWDRLTQYLRRYFLLGTPLAVSLALIVVAALRLADVQYASTLLNVAPFGVLFVWMVMAYTLCWWFEYQVNSVVAVRLLRLLGARGERDDEPVPYTLAAQPPADLSRVAVDGRFVAAHGLGELIVVGQVRENSSGRRLPAFHAYGYLGFFDAVFGPRQADVARDIGRRVQLYFALVNLLLLAGAALLAWHWGRGDRLNTVAPVLTARWTAPGDPPDPGHADLARQLAQDGARSRPSALVVAASGGGTRAALYTAAVLKGLHDLGVDERIALLSGVSGGGVAAAYFHAHRARLLAGGAEDCQRGDGAPTTAWDCFQHRMAMPFIGDVLRGASEWRIQSEQPLGVLLAESFERRLFTDAPAPGAAAPAPPAAARPAPRRLGDEPAVGLILNTTVTGHPVQDAPTLDGGFAPAQRPAGLPCQQRDLPVTLLAGGRLAFTNLRQVGAFASKDADAPGIVYPFVVVRDSAVGLAQAAALNANFPPVFPNARVDLQGFRRLGGDCDLRSYFVTDGGATENLGLISALLALDSALDAVPGDKRDIDIVLAEASAIAFDHTQDRGVGAATGGAKERLAGGLTLRLLERVRARAHPAQVRVHDLSMPRVFRSRGGFGTHWMFPTGVQLSNPLAMPVPSWGERLGKPFAPRVLQGVTLDRNQLFTVWGALFGPEPFCTVPAADPLVDADLEAVTNWVCGREDRHHTVARPDPQPARWAALRQTLRPDAPAALAPPGGSRP